MKNGIDLKRAAIIALVVVGLAAVATYCVTVTWDRNALRVALESTQGELASTENELVATQGVLAATQNDLVSTQTELAFTQDELVSTGSELSLTQADLASTEESLATTEVELASTQGTLTATESTLALVQAELATTKTDLTSTRQALLDSQVEVSAVRQQLSDVTEERDVALETLYGLGITISDSEKNYDADLVDNAAAVNPSWDELIGFLADDHTEDHEYIAGEYDCSEFSRDVHNNAEAAGIRVAVVHDHILLGGVHHALNAFLTTDYGLVYVDCTGYPDTIAYVVCGETFKAVEVGAISPLNVRNAAWWGALTGYYYIPTWYGAAITESITIFW